jgi:hypothetical protein
MYLSCLNWLKPKFFIIFHVYLWCGWETQSVAPHFAPCFIGKMDTTIAPFTAPFTSEVPPPHPSRQWKLAPHCGEGRCPKRGAGNGNSSPPKKNRGNYLVNLWVEIYNSNRNVVLLPLVVMSFTRIKIVFDLYFWIFSRLWRGEITYKGT